MDDLLHAVAYGGRGLGRRSVPAPERVEELLEQGEEQVEKWRSDWWVAERMVLVGVGAELEHGEFVKQAEKVLAWVRKKEVVMEEKTKGPSEGFFGSLVASLLPSPSPLLAASSYEELSSTPSSYVGGKICLDEGGDAEWLEGGTQVMLAFEGLSEGDEDLVSRNRSLLLVLDCSSDHGLLLLHRLDGARSHRHTPWRQEDLSTRSVVCLFRPFVLFSDFFFFAFRRSRNRHAVSSLPQPSASEPLRPCSQGIQPLLLRFRFVAP